MTSLPVQVAYAPTSLSGPLPQQERLPSIRDLDFAYETGQSNSSRPRQQQQQQQQQGEPISNTAQAHSRGRPQTSVWQAQAQSQSSSMPPPPSPASDYHHHTAPQTVSSLSNAKQEMGYMGPPASTAAAGGHNQPRGAVMHHKRPRSESTNSASVSPSTGRSPHSSYPHGHQYAGHAPASFSSVPPHPPHHPPPPPGSNNQQQVHPQTHPNSFAQHSGYQNYPPHYGQQAQQHPGPQARHPMPAPQTTGGANPTEHWQHQHQHHQHHHNQHQFQHPHAPQHPHQHPPHVSHHQNAQSQPMGPPPPPPPGAQTQVQHPPHPHAHSHHAPSQPPHPQQPPHPHPQHHQQPSAPHQPPHATYQHQQSSPSATRSVPIVPATLEHSHSSVANTLPTSEAEKAARRQACIPEIHKHCMTLYSFANRYANAPMPDQQQPSAQDIAEMAHRAQLVIRLIEELRRLSLPDEELTKNDPDAPPPQVEGRPPKRPWEDISQGDDAFGGAEQAPQSASYSAPGQKGQSMAEKDMAIIRSKRATNSGGLGPGAPKGKYRKRSRATPPGKCHSCNIRETPEWRRGPDGARTLCNACGLHYAKLVRKRDKGLGPDGQPARIDLEMLRASTKLANEKENAAQAEADEKKQQHPQQQSQSQSQETTPQLMQQSLSPSEGAKAQLLHQTPQAPYAYASVVNDGTNLSQDHGQTAPAASQSWSSPSARTYASDHQSFMRTSHPPSHARSSAA